MNMNLQALAGFAVKATQVNRTPLYAMSLEDARKEVKVVDGRKAKKGETLSEDGKVFTLKCGKKVLPLSPLGADFAGTDRLAGIPTEQYEAVEQMLLAQVAEGLFDVVIAEAQEAQKPKEKTPEEMAEDNAEGEETTEE